MSESKRYKDEDGPSPTIEEPSTDLSIGSKRRIGFNQILFTLTLTISTVVLLLSVYGASRNNGMLLKLEEYTVDVVNATNKTWGYGTIPSEYVSSSSDKPSHSHSGPGSLSNGNTLTQENIETYLTLPPENETLIYSHLWKTRKGEEAYSVFPITADIIDSRRPNEVITNTPYSVMIEKHVSTVLQFTKRPTENATFRAGRKDCVIQGFFPPLQSLHKNKTFETNGLPVDVWRLLSTVSGPHWHAGKEFINGGNYSFRAGMTYATRPDRGYKLGSMRAWPGMNNYTRLKFPCPLPGDEFDKWTKERVAIELTCEECVVRYDSVMRYPILQFELVF